MAMYVTDGKLVDVDDVRDLAAKCCQETARYERGERGRPNLLAEFDDAAAGVASEVAQAVAAAMRSRRLRFHSYWPWAMAGVLLRSGWQRGQRIEPHVVGEAADS